MIDKHMTCQKLHAHRDPFRDSMAHQILPLLDNRIRQAFMFFTAFGPMRLDPQANPAARSIQSFGFMQSHKLERWVLGPRQDPLVFAVFRASSLELHEAGNIRLETKAYKCSLRPLVIKELTASQQLPWSPLHTQYALG